MFLRRLNLHHEILKMAVNKNALIRYKTIDKCLRNNYVKWGLQDLNSACSDALYELEGRQINVSLRTTQLDIQMMRSSKLGYHAPIEVYEKKWYRYADPNYSITQIPLSKSDMSVLGESVEVLRQFKEFSLFKELNGIIQRLEDKLNTAGGHVEPIIHLDKNVLLKGLEFLDQLYQAILKRKCLRLTYQSFTASREATYVFHPYILKEYNNRWFLVGRADGQQRVLTLALDRMVEVAIAENVSYKKFNFQADDYYRHTIGVTVLGPNQLEEIVLRIDKFNAPYVLTKPLHSSQKLIKKYPDGTVDIGLRVQVNFEFERLVLGFGPSAEVLAPKSLRQRMRRKLEAAFQQYY